MENTEYVLRTHGICKTYGDQKVLDDVSLSVKRGEVYGFVGENGSGKTTIIRIICGLIYANAGSYELFGVDARSKDILKVRKKCGAIVESPSVYLNMTAMENMYMQGEIVGVKDKAKHLEILKNVGLEELIESKKSVENYSLGMRQRLGIAMALLSGAELLILDEPLNGLDPIGIAEIRELILKLNREQGVTFLISSHILSELSLVATNYGIISKGKIIKEISAEELAKLSRKSLILITDDNERAMQAVLPVAGDCEVTLTPSAVVITGEVNVSAVIRTIGEAGITVKSINSTQRTIEDYYLSLIRGGEKHE